MEPSATKELKATLWKAANKLRGSLSAGQYKDVILGLVFLKHVADVAVAISWWTTRNLRTSVGSSTSDGAVMAPTRRCECCRGCTKTSTSAGSVSWSSCSTALRPGGTPGARGT